MATYRSIASTETDPDSPVTSTLMVALAENPLALSQMAATAITAGEVNGAQFYQHALVTGAGDTDALIYDHAVDGTVASVQFALGADKLTGFEYRLICNRLSHNDGATKRTEMRFFMETSAAWTSWEAVGAGLWSASQPVSGDIRFSIAPLSPTIIGSGAMVALDVGSDTSNDASWSMTTVENVTLAEIRWSGGSIDAGEIYAFKRATYVGRE